MQIECLQILFQVSSEKKKLNGYKHISKSYFFLLCDIYPKYPFDLKGKQIVFVLLPFFFCWEFFFSRCYKCQLNNVLFCTHFQFTDFQWHNQISVTEILKYTWTEIHLCFDMLMQKPEIYNIYKKGYVLTKTTTLKLCLNSDIIQFSILFNHYLD